MNVATWNMQGAGHATEEKWNSGVLWLFRAVERWRPNAICLQEAGSPPKSAVWEAQSTALDPTGHAFTIEIYRWGTERSDHTIVFHQWDVEGNRVNLAIVTDRRLAKVETGLVWGAVPPQWRPVLALRVEGVWIFSLHAISPGGADAGPLLGAAASYAKRRPWLVGGDFNREPRTLAPVVPAESAVCPPNNYTYSTANPRSRYDYLVRSAAPASIGTVVSLYKSDHYPAAFEL